MNLKDNQVKSRYSFPVTLTTDEVDGGYTVTFRNLPEAITQGENIEDALLETADCLEEAIANRIIRRLAIPVPSQPANNEYLVTIPLQTSLKAAIWLAMQEKNLNQTEFAKTLGVNEKVEKIAVVKKKWLTFATSLLPL